MSREIVKSVYNNNVTGKLLSAVAAAASGYGAWRIWTNNNYIGQARANNLMRQGNIDLFTTNTGTYDPEAPVLSEIASWWRLRGREFDNGVQMFNSWAQSVFFYMGDAWAPLAALGGALGLGFRKEVGVLMNALGIFGKTFWKYVPKAPWGDLIKGGAKGLGKVTGQGAAALSGLFRRSPLAFGLLGLVAGGTGLKFMDVLNGRSQRQGIAEDFNAFYQ